MDHNPTARPLTRSEIWAERDRRAAEQRAAEVEWQAGRALMRALREGEVIDFEGVPVRKAEDQDLAPGDSYLAMRNTGPHLLTVSKVVREDNLVSGFVLAQEPAYPFDLPECVKIDFVEETLA